jgi:hypothetical protein
MSDEDLVRLEDEQTAAKIARLSEKSRDKKQDLKSGMRLL